MDMRGVNSETEVNRELGFANVESTWCLLGPLPCWLGYRKVGTTQ